MSVPVAPIDVLWSDDAVVAVLKPAGMPVQADTTGDTDVVSALQWQLDSPHLGLVHRLDRPVSGVMLFGRTPQATAALSAQFHDRVVTKLYWAIVEGVLTGERLLEHALEHDPFHRKARITDASHVQPNAVLHISTLATGDRYSALAIVPEGGAFHQIRAQLAATGHPIKGDVKYGARRGEKDRSIALYARSISFVHPTTGKPMTFVAPVPTNGIWKALLSGMVN